MQPPAGDTAEGEADPRPSAVRLLARREHSVHELRQKLRHKGFAAEPVEACLEALQAERLLSDARFAEAYVRMRAGRGYGPVRIRLELDERGVNSELGAQALAEAEADWEALAGQARRKRFGAALPQDFKERARQARFLQYRGFTAEQVRGVLRDAE